METVFQDLRYAVRMLLKSPGFTAVAVITLALGIGANTSIFSLVNALLLRSLPVRNPGELVVIGSPARTGGVSNGSPRGDLLSYPLYHELVANNEAFSDILATGRMPQVKVAVEENGRLQPAEPVRGRMVTENFFSVLGVSPMLGRTFTAEDGKAPGVDPLVVISYSYWQRRFNRDPGVVGRTLRVNGYPLTVIGVTSPGFFGEVVGDRQDVWLPMMMQAQLMPGRKFLDDVKTSWLLLIGRRKPGLGFEQAKASVAVEFQRIANSSFVGRYDIDNQPVFRKLKLQVSEGGRGLSSLRAEFNQPLLILMGIVALVLLIACVNVANLLLARSSARHTEIAVRLAIGASPARVARQLLTESVLLAFIGGAFGVLLATWGTQARVRLVTGAVGPLRLDVSPNPTVLAFTAGVSLLTGILFGLAPALRTRRIELQSALKEGTRGGVATGAPRHSASKYLIAGQVALSVLVLFTAAMLVRSLKNLRELDTGYQRDRLLLLRVDWTAGGYRGPRFQLAALEVLDRLRHLPGVKAAAFSENGLFSGTESADAIIVEGYTPHTDDDRVAREDYVGPGYFSAVGIPVIRGREISEQDTATTPRVTVVNEAFAQFYFPSQDPIGRKLAIDDAKWKNLPYEIVGVTRDARDHELRGPVGRRFYIPVAQAFEEPAGLNYEVRTGGNPGALSESARKVFAEFDPNLPVQSVRTLNDLVDESLSQQIVIAKLSTLFAALALSLACVGLYGLLSYAVAGRTREIGVRMALGARTRSLLWLVLREALTMVGAGVAVGIPLAVGFTRALRSMLFEVSAVDPISMTISMLLLGAVAALAAYLPARRATRVDPMVALHYE